MLDSSISSYESKLLNVDLFWWESNIKAAKFAVCSSTTDSITPRDLPVWMITVFGLQVCVI